MNARSFTLIEMLVTISIIAILAALITGPVTNALETSRRTACLNNMRQCGVGLDLYVQEKEHYPAASNMISLALNTLPSISEALAQYAPQNTFLCPSDNQDYYKNEKSSYEWNTFLNNQGKAVKFFNHTADPTRVWSFRDYEAFHGEENVEGSRNIVYLDLTGNPL